MLTNSTDAPFFWGGSGNFAKMPALVQNTYCFKVSGISVAPAVGDTYTNNSITYTISYVNLTNGAGSLLATGSGIPTTSGTLVRASGSGDANITFTASYANQDIAKAKCVRQYSNYLFLGNVVTSSFYYRSRIYWSNLKDDMVWLGTSYIDISKDDGQEIKNMMVMGDRLVVFKDRAIYNVFFSGNADIPFYVQKSNSAVGCIAPQSIQEIENGLVFLSYDGFYYYDGNNSYKLSWKIQNTLLGMNQTRFYQGVSMRQKNKNRYFCSLPSNGQSNNDTILVWDWKLDAWSIYNGMNAASMATVYNSITDERVYFGDYAGFVYRLDNGVDDYPLNVQTAINAYYYTNWKSFDDIVDQKGVPNAVIYYQNNNATITLVNAYDFDTSDTYTQTFYTGTSSSLYGSALYGTGTYASVGGAQQRRDLDGRGRVVRFGFKNSALSETFQIDGLGSYAHLETNV